MITELVSDDNNSYKLPLIKLVETKNMMVLTREEKRRLVLDLYNQGRTYREIAKEARISPRDIGIILRKAEQNNQRQQQEDLGRNDGKAAEPLDKTTQGIIDCIAFLTDPSSVTSSCTIFNGNFSFSATDFIFPLLLRSRIVAYVRNPFLANVKDVS